MKRKNFRSCQGRAQHWQTLVATAGEQSWAWTNWESEQMGLVALIAGRGCGVPRLASHSVTPHQVRPASGSTWMGYIV
ncbi:hypothetical protein [Xanthomonas campestris]|uniref:hypothetical protein n=1 Tax=Xanthomonas campestris TaxID=339 RepID=UPI00128FEB64|nr:hypothetical protein [Xanthomonas campestris]